MRHLLEQASCKDTVKGARRMNVELAIAALGWFVLAFGHTTIGLRRVLPNLTRDRLPSTPFAPPSMTLSMVRYTWHIVSVLLTAFGILLMALAWAPDADPRTLLLRWFAALSLAATVQACWQARRRPSRLLRRPVPWVLAVIAVMCWTAST
jgi:hypothetical protein